MNKWKSQQSVKLSLTSDKGDFSVILGEKKWDSSSPVRSLLQLATRALRKGELAPASKEEGRSKQNMMQLLLNLFLLLQCLLLMLILLHQLQCQAKTVQYVQQRTYWALRFQVQICTAATKPWLS